MSFFGGGADYDKINQQYQDIMRQAQDYMRQQQAQGRSDITGGINQAYGYNKPWMQAGTTALDAYMASLGIGPEGARGQQDVYNKFTTGPGYQFALNQGLNTVQQQAAARGLSGSGAEQRELQSTAQGTAQQQWDNYMSNYQNRLSDIAGKGETATSQQAEMQYGGGQALANLSLQYTNMNTDVLENMAKAQSEAEMAEAAQKSSMWGNIFGAVGAGVGGVLGSFGGPMGAQAGAAGGGALGKYFGGSGQSSNQSGYYDYGNQSFRGGGGQTNYFNPFQSNSKQGYFNYGGNNQYFNPWGNNR